MFDIKKYNKYDYFLFFLVLSIAMGTMGGALQSTRLLALFFSPYLFSNFKIVNKYYGRFLLYVLFFLVYAFVSLTWTPDLTEGTKDFIYYIIHFILFFEIILFSDLAHKPIESLSAGWVLAVAATLFVAVWEITTGQHLSYSYSTSDEVTLNTGMDIIERPFAAVTFGNYNAYITFLSFALPFLLLGLTYFRKRKKERFTFLAILATCVFVVLVNASRGAILAYALVFLIHFLMSKSRYKLFILIALAMVGIAISFFYSDNLLFAMLQARSGGLFEDEARMVIWSGCFHAFSETYGLGVGLGGVTVALKSANVAVASPHNLFIEFLIQFGVLVFIPFVFYYIHSIFTSIRQKSSMIKVLAVELLLALPIIGIINSGYLLDPLTFIVFASIVVFSNPKILYLNHPQLKEIVTGA